MLLIGLYYLESSPKEAKPEDLKQPGHVFPLMARDGGVLSRAGHTEAGCDLARLAGLPPFSVICEIMNDDGTMARLPDLIKFSRNISKDRNDCGFDRI